MNIEEMEESKLGYLETVQQVKRRRRSCAIRRSSTETSVLRTAAILFNHALSFTSYIDPAIDPPKVTKRVSILPSWPALRFRHDNNLLPPAAAAEYPHDSLLAIPLVTKGSKNFILKTLQERGCIATLSDADSLQSGHPNADQTP